MTEDATTLCKVLSVISQGTHTHTHTSMHAQVMKERSGYIQVLIQMHRNLIVLIIYIKKGVEWRLNSWEMIECSEIEMS